MKVIKEGRKQTGWAAELACTGLGNGKGGCGAVLLVEEGDLFSTESHARDETTYYVTFRCPQCGVMTDVPQFVYSPHHTLPTEREWAESHRGPGE